LSLGNSLSLRWHWLRALFVLDLTDSLCLRMTRICEARLMSALTPAAAQFGRLRVSACYQFDDP